MTLDEPTLTELHSELTPEQLQTQLTIHQCACRWGATIPDAPTRAPAAWVVVPQPALAAVRVSGPPAGDSGDTAPRLGASAATATKPESL